MNRCWVEPDVRDSVALYIEDRSVKSGISIQRLVKWMGINRAKFYDWRKRLGESNRHNGKIPKTNWLLPWEKEAIINYAKDHNSEYIFYCRDGYRRLTYIMLDEDVVAVSPATTYRVLKSAGLLNQWNTKKSLLKGKGYKQPAQAHKEWHTDIKYVNFRGTFLFLISVMDGFSRCIIHHELRVNMTEYDVEITIQRALEKFPDASPRIISDNGSQYISKDFQSFLKETELQHIRTSVNYPQSNGKIERFHRSINSECLKRHSLIDLEDARKQIAQYIEYYNTKRLHSALYYITPKDFLDEKFEEILNMRQKKLDKALDNRKNYWNYNKNIA